MSAKLAAFALVAAGLLLLTQESEAAPISTEEPAPDWLDAIMGAIGGNVAAPESNGNRAAFLAMIRASEGTAGANGYRMHFGGSLFDSYADHPRVKITKGIYTSSAAGAYQILAGTWDTVIQPKLHLPDFGPASQDAAALYLLQRRGALPAIDAGNFALAVAKAAPEWASLPGAGYGQPENALSRLVAIYQQAGGTVA